MKISVIIPTYKPENYLYECLESLTKQTFSKNDFEIILILNGCAEPYKSQIEKYIAENMLDMNINFIHTEDSGVSNARNIGLDNVRGEYVTFIDDDDVVSLNYLENLLKASSPVCIGCANSYCFTNNIDQTKENFISISYNKCKGTFFSLYRYRSFLSAPWAKLIHKNIIKDNRFPLDLKKSEDSMFGLFISPYVQDMKLTSDDTIYYQRKRCGSAMRTKQSVVNILKEHLYIEYKYIYEWCKHPFKYNFIFILSRVFACIKNCFTYVRRNL